MHAKYYTLTKVTKSQQVFSYLIRGRFLFRKINMSEFSGSKLLLFSSIISPAVENTLSAGTEVAGMQRKCFATLAIVGKRSAFFCHHCREFSSEERDCPFVLQCFPLHRFQVKKTMQCPWFFLGLSQRQRGFHILLHLDL